MLGKCWVPRKQCTHRDRYCSQPLPARVASLPPCALVCCLATSHSRRRSWFCVARRGLRMVCWRQVEARRHRSPMPSSPLCIFHSMCQKEDVNVWSLYSRSKQKYRKMLSWSCWFRVMTRNGVACTRVMRNGSGEPATAPRRQALVLTT